MGNILYSNDYHVVPGPRHYPGVDPYTGIPEPSASQPSPRSYYTSYERGWVQGAWNIVGLLKLDMLPDRSIAMCPSIPPDEPDVNGIDGTYFWTRAYTDRWWFQTRQRYLIPGNGWFYDYNNCDRRVFMAGGNFPITYFGRFNDAAFMITSSRYAHCHYGGSDVSGPRHNGRITVAYVNGSVNLAPSEWVRDQVQTRNRTFLGDYTQIIP